MLVATIALVAATMALASPAEAATDHCADHKTEIKVDADDSPATVLVPDTNGGFFEVVVTITGADIEIESTDPAIELSDADWCIKSARNTNDGTGTTGASTSMNKKGIVQDVSYLVIYSVTSGPPPQACDESTTSGGAGVTITNHELGTTGPTSFAFDYEPYFVPDQFQVFYDGVLLYDTGVIGGGAAGGTEVVNVPAGALTYVTVRVEGPSGTAWDYTVNCPVAAPH